MTPEQQAVLDILEDSKGLSYEKTETQGDNSYYSAVQVLSLTAIDRIKMLWNLPTNQEI